MRGKQLFYASNYLHTTSAKIKNAMQTKKNAGFSGFFSKPKMFNKIAEIHMCTRTRLMKMRGKTTTSNYLHTTSAK